MDTEFDNHDIDTTSIDATTSLASSAEYAANGHTVRPKRKRHTVEDSMRFDRAFVMTQIQHFFKDQKRRFVREVEQIRQAAELERKATETREQNMEEYLKWLGWHLDAGLKVDADFRKERNNLRAERDDLRSERDDLREECDSLTEECVRLRLERDVLLERLARNEVLRPVSIL